MKVKERKRDDRKAFYNLLNRGIDYVLDDDTIITDYDELLAALHAGKRVRLEAGNGLRKEWGFEV
jgi:hypothetical protein